MNEYRIEMKVKNNLLYTKMRQRGYETAASLSRDSKVGEGLIGEFLNLKKSPLNKHGEFSTTVEKLCSTLKCSPYEIFSDSQLHLALADNRYVKEVSEAEALFTLSHNTSDSLLINEIIEQEDVELDLKWIEEQLPTLTIREQRVIKMRFGIFPFEKPYTLKEIAALFNLSTEVIRCAESKALRKLRHPSRSQEFQDRKKLV